MTSSKGLGGPFSLPIEAIAASKPRRRGSVLGACALAILAGAVPLACYTDGEGTSPPLKSFYFPVGLATSSGGNVLYVVNSDFDLQWNGGTVQSYDLANIRRDTLSVINNPYDAGVSFASPTVGVPLPPLEDGGNPCLNWDVPMNLSNGTYQPLGETCAPPIDSTRYVKDYVVIGALATDIQLGPVGWPADGGTPIRRAYVVVRGDDSITWMDLADDSGDAGDDAAFFFDCNKGTDLRCDSAHHAGNQYDPGNSRAVSLPGEPFAMAISEDGTGLVLTHEGEENVSLLTTGFQGPPLPLPVADAGDDATPDAADAGDDATPNAADAASDSGVDAAMDATLPAAPIPAIGSYSLPPSLQFVAGGVPRNGGDGIATIVHEGTSCMSGSLDTCRPGFLWTSNQAAEVDLIRYYLDSAPAEQFGEDGGPFVTASLYRPYLARESGYPIVVNQPGVDERGIVIDPTPRFACLAKGVDPAVCATVPSRVFIASRSPTSLITGTLGGPSSANDGTYDPDRLILDGNVPLATGPSRVYLAPIIDQNGEYALRVWVVCYDSSTLFVYDPDAQMIENVIHVATGPFALAFDPFDLHDVAAHKTANPFGHAAPVSPLTPLAAGPTYRFGYVASFTDSYVQVIDLDNSAPPPSFYDATYQKIVFTLGSPTPPKGNE